MFKFALHSDLVEDLEVKMAKHAWRILSVSVGSWKRTRPISVQTAAPLLLWWK